MKSSKVILTSVGIVAVVVAVVTAFMMFTARKNDEVGNNVSESGISKLAVKSKPPHERIAKMNQTNGRHSPPMQAVTSPEYEVEDDPYENVSDEERKALTDGQCRMLDAIRAASDEENQKRLQEIVGEMQKTKGWPRSVPKIIRLEAVEALETFGVETLPEAACFLADPDTEVLQTAVGQFEDAVENSDLKDDVRAKILVMAAQVIKDTDTLDSMLFELNNMRYSVAAAAIKELWKSANKNVAAVLPDAIESVTGEDGIDTPEKLDAWLRQNPDENE